MPDVYNTCLFKRDQASHCTSRMSNLNFHSIFVIVVLVACVACANAVPVDPVEEVDHFEVNAASTANSNENYKKWLIENKVDIAGIEFSNAGPTGRGISTSRSFEANERIFSVPVRMFLSSEHVKQDAELHSIFGDVEKVGSQELLALLLMKEYTSGKSVYRPLLESLQYKKTSTSFFSPEDLQLLQGSSAFESAAQRQRNINTYYGETIAPIVENSKTLSLEVYSKDLFVWAIETVADFAVTIDMDGRGIPVIVPLQERIFHCSSPSAVVHLNAEEQLLEILAQDNIPAGTILCIHRGDKSDGNLLVQHGFLQDGINPHNVLVAQFEPKEDRWTSLRSAAAEVLNLDLNSTFAIDSSGVLHDRVYTLARINSLSSSEIAENEDSLYNDGLEDTARISLENERRALLLVSNTLQKMYEAVEPPADVATPTKHAALAVSLRRKEAQMLADTRANVLQRWTSLLEDWDVAPEAEEPSSEVDVE